MIAFIFADLIVLPILNIYRKYYGWKMTLFLLGSFYATMVAAGLVIEFLFDALDLIPSERNARVVEAHVSFNYTTVLNIVFLILSAALVMRFLKAGGPAMLRMMNAPRIEDGSGAAKFTCPMHPEIARAEPGRCPKCGMELVRVPSEASLGRRHDNP